jgi:hypothetical protein
VGGFRIADQGAVEIRREKANGSGGGIHAGRDSVRTTGCGAALR